MKVELSEKTAQLLIDALEDEITSLQRQASGYEDSISELAAVKRNMDLLVESIKIDIQELRRELSEKDAEIAILKEEKKDFIQSLSGSEPTP